MGNHGQQSCVNCLSTRMMSPALKQFLFALHAAIFALNLMLQIVHSEDRSADFISIDCGQIAVENYTQENTGLVYVSDAKFTDRGETYLFQGKNYLRQYLSLRSFPDGTRNCYKINVTRGNKYLIRAYFLYGNYDGLNKLPVFQLYLGPNLWDTVGFEKADFRTIKELIHVPPQNYVHICLANINSGVPFLSALDFRPLGKAAYEVETGSLSLVSRYDTGQAANNRVAYRYPFDIYDRIWWGFDDLDEWTLLKSNSSVAIVSQKSKYQPPDAVMHTAVAAANNSSAPSSSLRFWPRKQMASYGTTEPYAQYSIYMYFADVESSAPQFTNQSRLQDIIINGRVWRKSYAPPSLTATLVAKQKGLESISIVKAQNSTLPPILNAFEIYTVKEFLKPDTNQEDVDAMENIKLTYKIVRNWQGDPCSPRDYSWHGVECSDNGNEPPRIISLDLSKSGLTGVIALSISKLVMVQKLDLSNNNLTGPIPDSLSLLQNLTVLSLERNKLTGFVPEGLVEKGNKLELSLRLCNNPNLSGSFSCKKKKKKKKTTFAIVLVGGVSGVLILLLTTPTIWWFCRKKGKHGLFESRGRSFKKAEIDRITSKGKIIGQGGFGQVSHGTLEDGTQVAVKMLNSKSTRGSDSFKTEVKVLMRVHHKNLVSLIGYCDEGGILALVYEFVKKGDLRHFLSSADRTGNTSTWKQRLQIAIDSAQGVDYLHNCCRPPIIHRDLKTANILLDEKMRAKLADFGISKLLENESVTHVSTVPKGTIGYLDPEYWNTQQLNKRSDVYSFGIVLLEIITGRQAIINDIPPEDINISHWVMPMYRRRDVEGIVDPRMQGTYDHASAWKAIEIAMECVSEKAIERPDINAVLGQLKDSMEIQMASENAERTESSRNRSSSSSSSSVALQLRTDRNSESRRTI